MWEVDTETKTKLLALQKLPPNTLCADCSAPSPQWASPKFGIFICLSCAGLHRSLGVHISFVRSISMDAFKAPEIKRMELGGNEAWKTFWTEKNSGEWKVPPTQDVLEERYGGEIGEEWKERLSCKVEGREFAGVPKRPEPKTRTRVESPSPARTKKEANESYFARMGNENASRPNGVAPSQGGKYAGFGSAPEGEEEKKAMPGVDEFQKDAVAALTKGFGWFTSTVGKVNEGWVKPTAQKIAEADLATQARQTALSVGQTIQTGTKGAAESLNKFIDEGGSAGSRKGPSKAVEPERRDFWDSFGAPDATSAAAPMKKPGAIGTAAMRKGGKEDGRGKDDKWEDF